MIEDIVDSCSIPMFFVGDSKSDMDCAQNIGATPFAIQNTEAARLCEVCVVADLKEAADIIIAVLSS